MNEDHAPEDLTARARIRDAALRIFAERGIGPATIREIAKAAGVSSGLVRHHFGSKEALRDACDAYALDWSARSREQILERGGMADPGFLATVHPRAMLLQSYLVRSLLDGSQAAAARFDEVVRLSEEWLTDHRIGARDLRAHAAALAVAQIGAFALPDLMSRALGVDVRTPQGHARMLRGFVELFAHPLLTPEQTAQIHEALDQLSGEE